MAPHLHETRQPSPSPDVLKLKSANGPSCRPASGTFHRSVPVMPNQASFSCRIPPRSFRLQLFYTTPAAPAHPAILASWSRFVDESSYTLSAIDDILARVRALVA